MKTRIVIVIETVPKKFYLDDDSPEREECTGQVDKIFHDVVDEIIRDRITSNDVDGSFERNVMDCWRNVRPGNANIPEDVTSFKDFGEVTMRIRQERVK